MRAMRADPMGCDPSAWARRWKAGPPAIRRSQLAIETVRGDRADLVEALKPGRELLVGLLLRDRIRHRLEARILDGDHQLPRGSAGIGRAIRVDLYRQAEALGHVACLVELVQ